jgi:hypothetical protein
MAFPNFIIGGAPKCGTTSLYSWLSAHPDVCSSSVKETYYLYQPDENKNGIRTFTEAELEEYASFFTHCDQKKIVFEATPSYIYSESAMRALYRVNPELKCLFVLREPSDRLYSEYTFHRYKTGKFKGDFASYVVEDRLAESRYHDYISKWVTTFGKVNIYLIYFDDLKDRPKDLMIRLCQFLAIDPAIYSQFDFEQKNKTVVLRNKAIHQRLVGLINILPIGLIKRLAPIYYGMNSKKIPEISKEDKIEKERIKALFSTTWKSELHPYQELFFI